MSKNTKGPTAITLSMLEEEFMDIGEDLYRDISNVEVTLTRDVHFDAYDCSVCIYDRGGDDPVVAKIVEDLRGIADEERLRDGDPVDPSAVLSLFDGETLGLLISRGIRIGWNLGWSTEAMIDPATVKSTDRLYPEDQ